MAGRYVILLRVGDSWQYLRGVGLWIIWIEVVDKKLYQYPEDVKGHFYLSFQKFSISDRGDIRLLR